MHANETRVSQAFHSVGGGADSHEVLNSPGATGHFGSVTRQAIRPGNSDEVARTGEAQSTSGSLSEDQLTAFWAGIVANLDAARRVAKKIVSCENVDDVVHTAAVRFVESLQAPEPAPFPATDGELRALFLDIVRRYAIDCVRDSKRPVLPTHSHWGTTWEPVVGGHNVPDRELDSVFARNDEGDYDAPTAASRRDQDDLDQLHQILELHLDDLSDAQREILVESFFETGKRADIAARRGITKSTYDNHRQAAFKALRESLALDVEVSTGIDRSIWYDHVEELLERRAARLRGLSSSKKGKRSNPKRESANPEGKRDNPEGKRANPEGKRANLEGKRRNPRGERRNVEGERLPLKAERSNSAHERGNNLREGAADEPLSGTLPDARNESELVRRSA